MTRKSPLGASVRQEYISISTVFTVRIHPGHFLISRALCADVRLNFLMFPICLVLRSCQISVRCAVLSAHLCIRYISPFLGYVSSRSSCGSYVLSRRCNLRLLSRLPPLAYMVSPEVSGLGLYESCSFLVSDWSCMCLAFT
ncbi:uncharacterized protein LAESUDRAFT_197357 [Laetiporus sulphureus 93-53]|uniref:Uncharacterized protein n=1 Tax=Laetiporus sulphureus 93-53 TaxID=1314785 RepID=A0A165E236_9APHY|nr:uncharacterized protein LAESUDRAFT_197357 [Laetiporus sulphureus 93-53]KZT06097.1 hypothetical protein LAESUDRAFT_197357 [Laetiporus sulphureus 93-53]